MSIKDYYTAREAQEKLGLTKAMFHRRVNEGLIRKTVKPGYKQAIYSKVDIDALAASMNWVFAYHDRITFSRSTPGEQAQEMDIGIRCFGNEYITSLPERIAFQQKSQYTFWSLKVETKVVAYISMLRLPPDFLDDLLVGRKVEREITVNEVLAFVRGRPFDVYVGVLATDPDVPPRLRKLYAGLAIRHFADELLSLLGNGFLIRNIYTVTITKEGDMIAESLGFSIMSGKSQVPGRKAHMFPLDENGIKRLQHLSEREVHRQEVSETL